MTVAWSGVMTFVILKLVGFITPLRVTPEAEQMGLDITPARRVDPLLSCGVATASFCLSLTAAATAD